MVISVDSPTQVAETTPSHVLNQSTLTPPQENESENDEPYTPQGPKHVRPTYVIGQYLQSMSFEDGEKICHLSYEDLISLVITNAGLVSCLLLSFISLAKFLGVRFSFTFEVAFMFSLTWGKANKISVDYSCLTMKLPGC